MNYELAKQLKDAGYPQPSLYGVPVILEDGVYYPTLEEMIEACEDKDSYGFILKKHPDYWSAIIYRNGMQDGSVGKTPTEAVASLWVALNEKP